MTIEQFIRTQIETVDNLRAVLLLQSNPQMMWEVVAVSGRLYLPPETAARVLKGLVAKGLVEVSGMQYRFQPQTPELERLVEELAQLDREQPVSLINLLYARPEDVQAFGDAFRIRRKGN